MFRLKPEPRTRAQLRVFWFPVIRHHADANISVADKYGLRFPTWLEREVDRLTPARWLLSWGREDGQAEGAGERGLSPAPADSSSGRPEFTPAAWLC